MTQRLTDRVIVLTGAGRGLRLTQRTARKLPTEPSVFEFDVTNPAHAPALRDAMRQHGYDDALQRRLMCDNWLSALKRIWH